MYVYIYIHNIHIHIYISMHACTCTRVNPPTTAQQYKPLRCARAHVRAACRPPSLAEPAFVGGGTHRRRATFDRF